MKIAVYSRAYDDRGVQVLLNLLEILNKKGVEILLNESMFTFLGKRHTKAFFTILKSFDDFRDDLPYSVNYLISVGGDGTFLNSIERVRQRGIPVIGVNIGRLGFLSHISETDLQESVGKLLAGELPVEERTLLQVNVNGKPFDGFPYALNDMVIHKSLSGLITVHTWSNGELLNSYWADGLIVATPTGSTAYSLSVGGPIVAPESQNFIISPIAAHNMNIRPLVIPDTVTLRLKVECRADNHSFSLSLDSRSIECQHGTEIELKRAGFKIKVVKSSSFYTTLRNKLMWGVDKRN